ncbi:MAG: hypothetical protein KF847_05110 [Pirellulales bacterium]|nr:hypothetical protein [Pirellulales bacterium]
MPSRPVSFESLSVPVAASPTRSAPQTWRVALASFSILALELALIRLAPAEVKAISYFTNLILIASFFGLGIGCILVRGPRLAWLLPVGLLAMCGFILVARGIIVYDETRSVHYWLQDQAARSEAPRLPLFWTALAALVCSALPFASMGQELARRMDEHPRLTAYSWDIAGSLLGTIAFAASSYLQVPPWVWPPVVGVLWAALLSRRWLMRASVAAAGGAFLLFSQTSHLSVWSPYYLVQYEEEPAGLRVWVNSSFHQFALDFSAEDNQVVEETARRFCVPYDRYRACHDGRSPRRVLILGAGAGNDVNIALQNGAERIVAIEIDPAIYDLGRRLNRTLPYSDPRVEVRLDDARHYLHSSREEFDLVVFATLDSQTLLSGAANLRLENYVYTVEAFRDARRRLAADGMVGLYYSIMKPWLFERVVATVHAAFGPRLEFFRSREQFLFNATIVAGPGIEGFGADPALVEGLSGGRVNTDDWPYLYLERPTIAPVYWKLFAAASALVLGAFALLRTSTAASGWHVNFLLLGAGFTLLESAAIVRLALLFGSTWVVNAVVFAAALSTIFLANLAVMKNCAPSLPTAWIGLLASIAVNYVLPLQLLLGLDEAWRAVAAAALAGTPVFFAAVCFSRLFSEQESAGYALGINLVGAMLGAMIEYSSMYLGMRDVWLVLAGLYAAAILASRPPAEAFALGDWRTFRRIVSATQ